jgi:hypothetical protein
LCVTSAEARTLAARTRFDAIAEAASDQAERADA